MAEYALRLANGADTAARVRAADALGLTPNGTVRARGGLRPDGGGVVTVVAGTMNVQVTPFSCWVDASPAGQVGYPFVCDATKTLAIAAGDATLVRVDTVAVVVKENAFDGSGATTATLQIVQGTPGAGAPAMPTSASIPLRNISVPAGASAGSGGLSTGALSTDRRTYTAALGGIVPVATQAERDAMTKYRSLTVYRLDTDRMETYDGATWRPSNPTAMPFFKGIIPGGTAVGIGLLPWSSQEDTHAAWSNTTRLYTAPVAGLYRLDAVMKWNNAIPASPPIIGFTKNGTTIYMPGSQYYSIAFGSTTSSTVVRAGAGDTFSATLSQAALTLQSDAPAENNRLLIEYLRP